MPSLHIKWNPNFSFYDSKLIIKKKPRFNCYLESRKERNWGRKLDYLDWEGPKRGFSERGWKENLPRDGIAQSPWELLQQSLISIVAMNTPMWMITNTDTTQVSLRWRRRGDPDLSKPVFGSWGFSGGNMGGGGESLMSMNSEFSPAIEFSRKIQDCFLCEREKKQLSSSLRLAGNLLSCVCMSDKYK